MFAHVVMAGASITCLACGDAGRLPLPKAEGYTRAVEAWLREHKGCEPERRS